MWICFGGSYSGSLSAWFRLKYPHLVYGAIASSAPVKAEVNFDEFNDIMTDSLGDPKVNGSAECVAAIEEAFKTVDEKIANYKKLVDLQRDFKTCTDLSDVDDHFQFASSLADPFWGTYILQNLCLIPDRGPVCFKRSPQFECYLCY